jgi:hypothetical protein
MSDLAVAVADMVGAKVLLAVMRPWLAQSRPWTE